ncbi:hypothetical protein C8J56DRAFT_111987 [Mycena floridula]|nr:hypothetical protein C8J56DRAFT_111987 [Mycena floridula]
MYLSRFLIGCLLLTILYLYRRTIGTTFSLDSTRLFSSSLKPVSSQSSRRCFLLINFVAIPALEHVWGHNLPTCHTKTT